MYNYHSFDEQEFLIQELYYPEPEHHSSSCDEDVYNDWYFMTSQEMSAARRDGQDEELTDWDDDDES